MSSVRPALFLYIETTPPVRIWTGPQVYPLAGDDVDLTGGDYLPLGLASFPAIDRLIDDQAGEYDLAVSGIDAETLGLLEVPSDISGARAHLGQIKFDAHWQPTAGVDWLADYDAESVSWSLVQAEDGDGHEAAVSLRLGSASTDRRMSALTNWSAVEQAVISATDDFFEFMNSLSLGTTRRYPA